MSDITDKPMGTGGDPYIWLRYTTQFTTGGRTHTIEMGIPVPLGASTETREKLIREAEIGMEQLSRHVENRVNQLLQRTATRPPEVGRPLQESNYRSTTETSYGGARPSTPATSSNTPLTSQPPSSANREAPVPQEPGRQMVGASMPLSPNMPGGASGNMKLSQFMQYIRETWGMTPKEAMELLNVKTLNGMNYREALKQLQPLVAAKQSGKNVGAPFMTPNANREQSGASTPNKNSSAPSQSPPSSARPNTGIPQGAPVRPEQPNTTNQKNVNASEPKELKQAPQTPQRTPAPASSPSPARPAPAPAPTPIIPKSSTPSPTTARPNIGAQPGASNEKSGSSSAPSGPKPAMPVSSSEKTGGSGVKPTPLNTPAAPTASTGSSKLPIYPIDGGKVREMPRIYKFDEEDDRELELEEDEDDTEQQRIIARLKLDELKEARGSAPASPARLTVLQNVLNSQISDEQLQQLIEAAWGATNVKKLKVDQIEALISWAKEDFFVDEVEAVLALIEEEIPL